MGKIDEEKFKVEGIKFKLHLYKKWNLISVPFRLWNNNITEVFKDVKGVIKSVWTYNGTHWFVWTPDDAPDGLKTIEPGWGYWVLTTDDVELTLGGSLLAPPPATPPSRNLIKGWNLIGYYGATSMNHHCGDWWDDWWYEQPVYCALNSLVDTQEGFPRWSSLWTYYNEDGHGYWYGLNACCKSVHGWYTWCLDYMEAGQGYWIEMDVEDGYAPATNCIWNENLRCV